MLITEAIERVNLDDLTVTLADGTVLQITDMFDSDGEACDDIDECVALVAGTEDFGWIDIMVGPQETVH